MKKLIISIMLVLAIMVGIVPALTLTVFAASNTSSNSQYSAMTDTLEYLTPQEAEAFIAFMYNKTRSQLTESEKNDNSLYDYLTGQIPRGTYEYELAQMMFLVMSAESINKHMGNEAGRIETSVNNLTTFFKSKIGSGAEQEMVNACVGDLKSKSRALVLDLIGDNGSIDMFESVFKGIKDIVNIKEEAQKFVDELKALFEFANLIAANNNRKAYAYYISYVNARHFLDTNKQTGEMIFNLYFAALDLSFSPLDVLGSVLDAFGAGHSWTSGDVQHLLNTFAEFTYHSQEEFNSYVSFEKESLTISDEKSYKNPATLICVDGTNGQITYSSSDPEIATVNETGEITPVHIGTALITATASNGKKAVCVVDVLPISGYCGGEGNGSNLIWEFDRNDSLIIHGNGTMANCVKYNKVPWSNYVTQIKSVVIKDGVTSIGDNVFRDCTSITSIDIGSGVTNISNYAFSNCTNLTSVDIGSGVTTIGNYAFRDCTSLTSVDIPDNVTSIGLRAFEDCTSLTSVDIGSGVTNIGNYAFSNCTSLTSVDIGSGVTSIGTYAFSNCSGLTSVDIPDSVTSIGNYAFSNCTSLSSVDIGSGVTTIGNSAFESCMNLTSVDIGSSVTTIGSSAFESCMNLTSVDIGSGVTSIGNHAFSNCTSLLSITVDENNTAYSSDEYGVLLNKSKTILIQYPIGFERIAYDIPDSVTSISNNAFQYCTSLTSIDIPDGVTSIGSAAFRDCTGLTSVDIPDSVANIGDYAFRGCTSLASVDIPDSAANIGDYAFRGCTSLASVDIGSGVTTIGTYAFSNCTSLTKATVYSRNATFSSNLFYETPATLKIHGYTDSTAETYANANGHTFVALDAAPEPFELSGVTMTLGSSLSLDFAVDTAKLTGTDNYAEFTIVYADGRPSETVTVPQSEWTKYSGTIYTAKFTGMAAKQMNDVVTAVFYNADGQPLTIEKSDSIETYAVRMLNGSAASNKKLRTVYVDMLNYGAAAQAQFDYDEANFANRNLTDAHKAWATTSVATTDNRVKGTGYAGSTLTLSGEIQLDLVFNNSAVGKDYSTLYAIATYTDHYGNEKSVRIEGSDFIKYGSTMCQVSITGMAVADYKSVVSCTVYNAGGVALANASDSVESYANRNAASLGATVDTIVKFGASSYNYFH